jgi:hypothetical protein
MLSGGSALTDLRHVRKDISIAEPLSPGYSDMETLDAKSSYLKTAWDLRLPKAAQAALADHRQHR